MSNATLDHSLGKPTYTQTSSSSNYVSPSRFDIFLGNRAQSAVTPALNNYRVNLFHELVGALDDMAKLEADDDFYVDTDIKVAAVKVLNFVCRTDLDLPKILPEYSDCLSFTWDAGDLRGFLTIYSDELEYTIYRKSSGIRCVRKLNFDGMLGYDEIGKAIEVTAKVTTTS